MRVAKDLLKEIALIESGELPTNRTLSVYLDAKVQTLGYRIANSWEELDADEKEQVDSAYRKMLLTLGEHFLSVARAEKRKMIVNFSTLLLAVVFILIFILL